MTPEKILEVIATYREMFTNLGPVLIRKINFPHGEMVFRQKDQLSHCFGMLDQMEEFVAEGRVDKAFRWLGFIQGVLWANRCYTLDDMKNHNRSPENEAA